MKKKQLNILLIIIVLSIWGKVIYNYTSRFYKRDNVSSNDFIYKPFLKVERNQYALNLLERDPFLGNLFNREKDIKKNNKLKKIIGKSNLKKWPKLLYLGFIKNKSTKEKLAIIKVNGKIKNCKNNSYFNENIYIRAVFKDSVILRINNIYKTIIK